MCLDITELLRENKRMLDKAIRELDRERMALQNQEKKVIAEIKKTAKQGQMVQHAKGVKFLILVLVTWHSCSPPLCAGRCQGHGQVTCQEQTCCNKDVRPKVSATSSFLADTGQHASTLLLLICCQHCT